MGRLAAFAPSKADPWDARKAAHLLNRAGFGGTPAEVEELVRTGPEAAVRGLVRFEQVLDQTPPPRWVTDPPEFEAPPAMDRGQNAQEQRRQVLRLVRREQRRMMEELRSWWLQRMTATPRPLQEKLTLFWHGHFATQARKIRSPQLMYEQNELFRRHAAGSFKTLVSQVSRDPAMLRFLDNNTNRKEHPNENFARELLELFTMGIGNYTEEDVKEAARAFTGWSAAIRPGRMMAGAGAGRAMMQARIVLETKPQFVFRPRFHDEGRKRFLGRAGPFGGQEIVNIIFEQPVTAAFICRKLYAYFAGDEPAPEGAVEALAETLRAFDYELRPVLEELFRSELFYSDRVIGAQIKSPAQLVAQAVRQLQATVEPPAFLTFALREMGQNLLDPPNVGGWDGGRAWINTTTLLARYNFAGFLFHGPPARGRGRRAPGRMRMFRGPTAETSLDTGAFVPPEARRDADTLVRTLERRLLIVPLDEEQRAELAAAVKHSADDVEAQIKTLIHLMMSTPNYQLC